MHEDDYADDLDPRVQVELESLNVCTEEINRLEIQLDEANAQFRNALSESTQRLKYLSSRLGKCIDKSRPYYEAVDQAKKCQLDCQKAAIQFQRAASLHATAKETIFVAEQKFLSRQDEWQFDTTWQEMLNHATAKVMEADVQRADSEKEHQKRAILFAKAEQNVQQLEQKLKSAITKSKPYFETKDIFQTELQLLKERVQNLQKAVVQAKERYAQALRNLEAISEQIHEKRKLRLPREPGVGAEELDLTTLRLEEPRPSTDTTGDRDSTTSDSASAESNCCCSPLRNCEASGLSSAKPATRTTVAGQGDFQFPVCHKSSDFDSSSRHVPALAPSSLVEPETEVAEHRHRSQRQSDPAVRREAVSAVQRSPTTPLDLGFEDVAIS